MTTALNYLQAQLHLNVSTLCGHLRNKAYPQKSEAIYNAMSTLVYHQILVDELDRILWNHKQLVGALNKFLVGDNFNLVAGNDDTIYQHCLLYFTSDCGLGTATPELSQWVATSADRNQTLRQSFYTFFPDVDVQIAKEGEIRPASEAEQFEVNTESFLRDIETSNSLVEFNQLMARVRVMIEGEAPVAEILSVLNAESSL